MTTSMALYSPRSLDGESRVEDYLNDKLQTFADLESIDVLLHGVLQQQLLLRQQVPNLRPLECLLANNL